MRLKGLNFIYERIINEITDSRSKSPEHVLLTEENDPTATLTEKHTQNQPIDPVIDVVHVSKECLPSSPLPAGKALEDASLSAESSAVKPLSVDSEPGDSDREPSIHMGSDSRSVSAARSLIQKSTESEEDINMEIDVVISPPPPSIGIF